MWSLWSVLAWRRQPSTTKGWMILLLTALPCVSSISCRAACSLIVWYHMSSVINPSVRYHWITHKWEPQYKESIKAAIRDLVRGSGVPLLSYSSSKLYRWQMEKYDSALHAESPAIIGPAPPPPPPVASGSRPVRPGTSNLRERYGLKREELVGRNAAPKSWEEEYNAYMATPYAAPHENLVQWWRVILSLARYRRPALINLP